MLGTSCPVVPCDHDLNGHGLSDATALLCALSGPGSARGQQAWESAEAMSSCARDVWEGAEAAAACARDDAWECTEPGGRVDMPPCHASAAVTDGQREREPSRAPLHPEVLKGYFPLVRKLVRQVSRHLPPNVQRDDLLSAGLLGLVDSLRKNGGSDGETFAGYAKLRIRGAIVDELRAQDWLSRRAREAVEAGAANKSCGTTVFVSLSDVTPTEESVHLSGGDDPIEAMSAHATRRALVGAIAQLPERERRVIGMYYFEGAKLKDIGAVLGVGEPRVSQLHTRALGMLRGMLSQA